MRRTGPSGSRAATGRPQGGREGVPSRRVWCKTCVVQFDRIDASEGSNWPCLLPAAGRSRHGSRTALSASLWPSRSPSLVLLAFCGRLDIVLWRRASSAGLSVFHMHTHTHTSYSKGVSNEGGGEEKEKCVCHTSFYSLLSVFFLSLLSRPSFLAYLKSVVPFLSGVCVSK